MRKTIFKIGILLLIFTTTAQAQLTPSYWWKCSNGNTSYNYNPAIVLNNNQNIALDSIPYFEEYGITITVLGMKEGVSYENDEIQKAIDAKFASEQELVIQQNKNEAALAKAEADAAATIMAAEAQAQANALLSESMTPALLEKMYYEKWNGELPYIYGDSTPIIQVP